ncbi:MAG: tetratricopeptide repeat protein, partial [Woeseiaceae bacterium]|nr:tetratricopeptide repeat protein [Woeseiaceae bacterium]
LANAFFKAGRFELALDLCDELLANEPQNADYEVLRAASLVKLGRYEEATRSYEQLLETRPDDAEILLRYSVALRIVGRSEDAIRASRQVLVQQPDNGEAYWNLANMKTFRFESAEVAAMRGALDNEGMAVGSRIYLLFALGKAMADAGQFDESFRFYFDGNELAKSLGRYNPEDNAALARRSLQVFTREFFEARTGGCAAPDPIFIVGLPRSGSTLLEQILANHSAIDATMELSEITAMVRSLDNPDRSGAASRYPGVVAELGAEELTRLGEEYLKRTRCFRGERRHFIDKAPHNFLHIGLIASILPNAKIIDARRNPLASGWSIYTQHFARGTNYTYDLQHIGLYYRDYLSLMDHWHAVLPGKILTVQYEDVVEDMERELRRILDYCALEFEPACLDFYKSKRAVATVSSEQVRQPIYSSALDHWKNYERHLGPLKAALRDTTS